MLINLIRNVIRALYLMLEQTVFLDIQYLNLLFILTKFQNKTNVKNLKNWYGITTRTTKQSYHVQYIHKKDINTFNLNCLYLVVY